MRMLLRMAPVLLLCMLGMPCFATAQYHSPPMGATTFMVAAHTDGFVDVMLKLDKFLALHDLAAPAPMNSQAGSRQCIAFTQMNRGTTVTVQKTIFRRPRDGL